MDFEAAIRTINRDFCNLFLAKYLKSEWGITAGYNTVPDYLALMRKEIADWQIVNCNNEWCSIVSTSGDTCPTGYTLTMFTDVSGNTYPYCSVGGCPPGQQPVIVAGVSICQACSPSAPCLSPNPILADLTIVQYGTMFPQGKCILNPPLSAWGHRKRRGHLNVNEILIGTFRR